jgi:UDP-glucose 4-epimerase
MILVTGGTGFIGSHVCVALAARGHDFVIVDNLSNSSADVVDRLGRITGRKVSFIKADAAKRAAMGRVFDDYRIDAAIHLAGYKAVGESVQKPLAYYRNNIDSALTLCELMAERGSKALLFSSSATVYSSDNPMPLDEGAALGCTNPYGWTKLMIEQILKDTCAADQSWSVVSLRYFNPVGAHPSALIGENPMGTPNNLMPSMLDVAAGKRDRLHIFGDDYPTPDGTGVRDYIHVMDLAEGHVNALEYMMRHKGFDPINLGTGRGYSVLEMIHTFEKASGQSVPYVVDDRRPGDIAICYAKTDKAKALLGWQATRSIDDMCGDAWRWACTRSEG